MADRKAILDRLRQAELPTRELPDWPSASSRQQTWVQYDDPLQQFADVLKSVGGSCSQLQNTQQVAAWLPQYDAFHQARRVLSLVAGISGNVDIRSIHDPHQLADVDLVIAAGSIAVAENGAVWVDDRGKNGNENENEQELENIPHRAALFIAQHAVLIVPRAAIVHNLHEAYERIQFTERGFGVFISGPSKTADIEQSLVIGAHGPKSLHVVLVG